MDEMNLLAGGASGLLPSGASGVPHVVRRELVLGGQKSGKSRRAEALAAAWLASAPGRRAVLIATASAGDDEMRARIERHQRERAARVPGMTTVEASPDLPAAITSAGGAETLRVVDCLTLWLTQQIMPDGVSNQKVPLAQADKAETARLLRAIEDCSGPLVLVGNEIGLGVIPLGREVRAFVDALGALNQSVAAVCDRVTLMVAGLRMTVKGAP